MQPNVDWILVQISYYLLPYANWGDDYDGWPNNALFAYEAEYRLTIIKDKR